MASASGASGASGDASLSSESSASPGLPFTLLIAGSTIGIFGATAMSVGFTLPFADPLVTEELVLVGLAFVSTPGILFLLAPGAVLAASGYLLLPDQISAGAYSAFATALLFEGAALMALGAATVMVGTAFLLSGRELSEAGSTTSIPIFTGGLTALAGGDAALGLSFYFRPDEEEE